ncbi:sigma-54 dependent transcriptional regulator, partial [Arhodomonas sp. KWT]
MPRVLVIEDEKVIRSAIRRLLTRHGMSVTEAGSLEEAEDSTALADHDIILADLRLPGAEGIEAVRRAAEVPVIIMTSYASVRSAVEAMREGAVDYIAKPFDNDDLLLTVERALKETRLERQNEALRADVAAEYPVSGIVGDSEAMQAVFRRIGKVAPTDTTVLILGESGTGKELVARALHERSTRKEAALVAVNCAAIPESLIEAELFGHEKGAFTGAEGRRRGLVESADGG